MHMQSFWHCSIQFCEYIYMWDPEMLGIITHVTAFNCYLSALMHSQTHIHLNTLLWLQYLLGGLAEIDVNLVTGRETQTTPATYQPIRSSSGSGKPWRTMTMNESQVASVCDWDIQSANEWICWATGKLSQGLRKFCVKKFGEPNSLPRVHTW